MAQCDLRCQSDRCAGTAERLDRGGGLDFGSIEALTTFGRRTIRVATNRGHDAESTTRQ